MIVGTPPLLSSHLGNSVYAGSKLSITVFKGCERYPFTPEHLSKDAYVSQQEHTVSFSRCRYISRLLVLSDSYSDGWAAVICKRSTRYNGKEQWPLV